MYIPVKVGLSDAHLRKIIKGYPVKVQKSLVGSGAGNMLLLNKTQHKKLMTGRGKTVSIAFSPAQIKKNIKHGGSLWGFIKKAAKVIAPYAKKLAGQALRAGAASYGGPAGAAAANFLLPKVGLGARKRGRPRKVGVGGLRTGAGKRKVGRPKGRKTGKGGLYI